MWTSDNLTALNFLELRKAEVQLPRTIPLQQEIG
jgi:hypothetical protein